MKELQEINNADVGSEMELIRQVKQGNRYAFTQLVNPYQKDVFKLAYGFFRDRDDAMEIVQETFLRIYQKLDRFDGGSTPTAFRNWIYRIAYRLCIDFYRKYKKKKVEEQELYNFQESHRENDSPPDKLERLHFKQSLEKLVMTLSKRQKSIFILKHYSGLKHKEISEILNISVGTAKSLYFRAVRSLEKDIKQKFPEYEVVK
ncbi:MAG: RNA polymerase sigma factor [bacterium]|nr:RNA polymerase sigma factor [bacterium]